MNESTYSTLSLGVHQSNGDQRVPMEVSIGMTRRPSWSAYFPISLALLAVLSLAGTSVAQESKAQPLPMFQDWSTSHLAYADQDHLDLGTADTANRMYPAKFSFDATATPSCANDLIVSSVAAAGGTGICNLNGDEPVHLTTDWSHRHLVFSPSDSLIQQFRWSSNTRYVQQWVRRNAEHRGEKDAWRRHHAQENLLHGDWSVYLGNVGTVGAGQYPAKFSFDATTVNCGTATQPDFVVWNTGLAGSGTAVAALTIGTFSGIPANGQTIIITNGANSVTLTASGTSNAGLNWRTSGTIATDATNLTAAINRNNATLGVTATANAPANGQVTITANAAGTAGNNITVTDNLTNFSFPFAGTTSNLVDGASGVASIAAYDNLYSSCTGTVPSAYWSYNTGGTAPTSVVLALNGKQVAFVQSQAGVANLVILKWAAASGTVSAPTTLTTQASAAAYRSCTAPCMFTIALNGGRDDTNSSPYYDYDSDTLYVGDDPVTEGNGGTNATLHKFTGIFNGTPAEVVGGGWPAPLGVELATSPVYDSAAGQVYVADSNTVGTPPSGGFLYRVNATSGAVVKSGGLARGVGFADGPVLNQTNQTLYLYTSDGSYPNGCPDATTTNNVLQMAANFAAGATAVTSAVVSTVGTCSNTLPLYAGDFDNAFYTGGAGNIYVCGGIGGNPTLFQVAISATGALGAVTTGPAIATAATTCSSVTEFYNPNGAGGAKDRIFLSTQASAVTAAPISCPAASGCLMSFDVTSGAAITTNTATVARLTVSGGASGVIIDNSSAATGASQVYFTPLATGSCTTSASQGIGGCAIQASQSALN